MRFAILALLLAACTDAATPSADATLAALDARDAVLAPDAADALALDDVALGLLDGGAR